MANFKASYGEMESMAGRLAAGQEAIEEILQRLKADVDRLLGDDFQTEHASGKFGDGYAELTNGLSRASAGISDMGTSLTSMMRAIQDTDRALAGQ